MAETSRKEREIHWAQFYANDYNNIVNSAEYQHLIEKWENLNEELVKLEFTLNGINNWHNECTLFDKWRSKIGILEYVFDQDFLIFRLSDELSLNATIFEFPDGESTTMLFPALDNNDVKQKFAEENQISVEDIALYYVATVTRKGNAIDILLTALIPVTAPVPTSAPQPQSTSNIKQEL